MPPITGIAVWESPFARSGGIGAVLDHLPAALRRRTRSRTVVFVPYHFRMPATVALRAERLGEVDVPLEGRPVSVRVLRHTDRAGVEWVLLEPLDAALHASEDGRLFAGRPHPYLVRDHATLVRDALFFGAAVVRSLEVVAGPDAGWRLSLHDWEAATTVLAAASYGLRRARFLLTLHNSYDSGAVPPERLQGCGISPASCPGPPGATSASVLERALPLVLPPVTTVSSQFATELLDEDLHRISAGHLAPALRGRLVGVPNGPFVTEVPAAVQEVLSRDDGGAGLRAWKHGRRQAFLEKLREFDFSSEDFPSDGASPRERADHSPAWGDVGSFGEGQDEATAWFVLGGRDDSRQRGHDVAAAAVDALVSAGSDARFLFLVIPGDEGLEGLRFLHALARRHPRQVLVLPFPFREGFLHSVQGAAMGVFPSLYEPYGGVGEFLANGTLPLARATGGILEQVAPWRACAAFGDAVSRRSSRWFGGGSTPGGILYREPDGEHTEDWRAIDRGEVGAGGPGPGPDRLTERLRLSLVREMADELRVALEEATRLWRDEGELYRRMLVSGLDHQRLTFSWDRAAQEYIRLLG